MVNSNSLWLSRMLAREDELKQSNLKIRTLHEDEEPEEELAITGATHTNMAKYAGLLVALGAALMLIARKRKDGEILLWAHSEIKYVS